MASIRKEITLAVPAEEVWDVIQDYGNVHTRLAPGFVVDTKLEQGARVVTFANGLVARELIVDVDDEARRLVWSVVGSERLTHHNGAFQVFADGAGARLVWTADLLPHAAKPDIAGLMEHGMAVIKRTLEGATQSAALSA